MDPHARESYLEGQVLTATPQKLRLMLIDGAIRFARKTQRHIEEGDRDNAFESLVRCREILSELLGAIRPDESDLARMVGSIYVVLIQTLATVQLREDTERIQEVIDVLEIERETWRQVCQAMPQPPSAEAKARHASQEITASNLKAIPPIAAPSASLAGPGQQGSPAAEKPGFSMDA